MIYFVVEPFALNTPRGTITFAVGKIVELTGEQAARLVGKVMLADALHLWRWFALEADRVYRTSPITAEAWARHKVLKKSADDYCRIGDIPAAREELEKALKALRGATVTQQELIAA